MTEAEKNIVTRLATIKTLAPEKSVQELADTLMSYVQTSSKDKIGFNSEASNEAK